MQRAGQEREPFSAVREAGTDRALDTFEIVPDSGCLTLRCFCLDSGGEMLDVSTFCLSLDRVRLETGLVVPFMMPATCFAGSSTSDVPPDAIVCWGMGRDPLDDPRSRRSTVMLRHP